MFVVTYPITTTCNHLFGEEHTVTHKMSIGVIVMVMGVCVAKLGHFFINPIGQYAVDIVGYGIHGTGLAPFLDHFSKIIKDNKCQEKEQQEQVTNNQD